MVKIPDVRPSPIAGQWYEGDPRMLAVQVDQYMDNARLPEISGEVIGIIVPHAGHIYSGQTAGYAFQAVRGMSPDLVAVVSPLHSYTGHPLLTSAHRSYSTPLGPIEIDSQAVDRFIQALAGTASEELHQLAYDREHSLEIEIPFLQRALSVEWKLLPVMIHTKEQALIQQAASALAAALEGHRYLLVASTDLSHFYPQDDAERLDSEMLRQFAEFSPEGVLEAERKGTGFACGAPAVAMVLWAARELGADVVQVLHHSTSAEVTGDFNSVVGYGAGVILKR